ncbi:MAG: hypothetical protein GY757_28295, partial [bacterium]|nr:hypothetical protein [bacterium]
MKIGITLLVCFIVIICQPVVATTHSPGIDWKKIDTPHFEIVFPVEITGEAQRVANTLEYFLEPLTKTLGKKTRRITLVLSNRGTIANGWVGLSPYMSEWFSVPSVKVVDWYQNLALHEGRHIIQYNKINKGFTKLAYILFGDSGLSALSQIAMPNWYMEGDAVIMETLLTEGGRGREPSFDMHLRAQRLSGIRYDFQKNVLGSYKNLTPNEYTLGYFLSTYARRKYGAEIWNKVFDRTANNAFFPLIFPLALKKETGKTDIQLYESTMEELEHLWKKQLAGLKLSVFETLNKRHKKKWEAYTFPHGHSDGSIIALKSGLDHLKTLVRIQDGGEEEKIKTIAPLMTLAGGITRQKNIIAWAERVPDSRWAKRSYSEIAVCDLDTGKTKRISNKTKYYAPVLSHDAKRIAMVEFTPDRTASIVILDTATGKELQRLTGKRNTIPYAPSWSENDRRIVFTFKNKKGIAIKIWDTTDNSQKSILPAGMENISFPLFYGNYILYCSSYSGIDNIYAVEQVTGRRYQVTSVKFGAFYPALTAGGKELLFSNYTALGNDVARMKLEPGEWKRIEEVEDRSLNYFLPLLEQEQGKAIPDCVDIPIKEYEVKGYLGWKPRLNFHSREIEYTDPEMRLNFLSNDKLSKTALTAGVVFNRNERVFRFDMEGRYSGLYPELEFGGGYGNRGFSYMNSEGGIGSSNWRETTAFCGIRVPLNLSRGIYSTGISIGTHLSYIHITLPDEFVMGTTDDGF